MKTLKYSIGLCIAILCLGCKKFLEVTPKDFLNPEIYFQDETQTTAALNTVYRTLAANELYGDKMQSELALQADEGFNYNASPAIGNVRHYDVSVTDKDVYGFWSALYKGIDRANFFLENIHRPEMNEVKRQQMKGEVTFLRGYFYFLLVQNFGDVPLKLQSSKTVDDSYLARTPLKEVYGQILKDMTEAEQLVAEIDQLGFGGRVSKSAVQGILSRVCLFMAGYPLRDQSKWQEAKNWAYKVISSGKHQLNPNYEQVFINYAKDLYDTKESIFEVEFWGDNTPPYLNGGKVGLNVGGPLYQRLVSDVYGVSYGWINCTKWLHDLYPVADVRRNRNISNYMFNATTGAIVDRSAITPYGRSARKWDRRDEPAAMRNKTFSSQNFPVLRYPDVLLMYAEANNELNGNADSTLLCINMIRRRGLNANIQSPNAVDLTVGLNTATLRTHIQNERAKELCYEALRKGDLVRWGIFLERMQFCNTEMTAAPGWGTNVRKAYFSNATARDVVWPIPDLEIGLNKKLTQNDGWK